MKILVSDELSQQGIDILQNTNGIEVDVKTGLKPEELKKIIGDYHGLIVRSATKVTSDIIEYAKSMKIIGRAGSGVDNIDVNSASKKGIIVMNTPGGNTVTTAEHTIALMLSMVRMVPQATASTKSGKWEKKKFIGVEIYNKTLGLIGIGNIGTVVAERAVGLKMKVIAFDPYITEDKAKRLGIELTTLDDLFKRADIITVHTPLSKETKGLIGDEAFKKMKSGVMVINCARGGIVDEKALYDAIKSGKVARAALDVFEKEPPGDLPLLTLEEVVCTPHLGASTEEAQVNVAIDVAKQIVEYFKEGTIRNAVNFPSVPPEILVYMRPYLTLSEKLGSFISQISEGALEKVYIEYSGEVFDFDIKPLTIAVLKGLFTPILDESVNFVNAPLIAKERGIEVIESKLTTSKDFASQISVKAKTEKSAKVVVGAMFGKNDPRIVRIDGFLLEAVPEGSILMLENWDKPGVIGNIGTLLGENNVNIARMEIGRDKPGGKAISILNIDQAINGKLLQKLHELPNIISAKAIYL